MPQSDARKTAVREAGIVKNAQPLNLIVGHHKVSPCDHETFERFKLWVADSLAQREIETYSRDNVVIEHWDNQSGDRYSHLLNPCECGTYLPMEIEPTPMFSSAIGLLSDLNQLKDFGKYAGGIRRDCRRDDADGRAQSGNEYRT